MLQEYIEEMDSVRVNPFVDMSTTTKKLSDKAKEETSAAKRQKFLKLKDRKFNVSYTIIKLSSTWLTFEQDLRIRALELKGYYLVAKAMADTYTEVSTGYIIPGVNRIERLSLPEAKNLTKEERAAKISEVGLLAQTAKDEVKRIANQVSKTYKNSVKGIGLIFCS